jgi:adenylate cyclase
MGIEIERKFLLRNEDWRADADNGTRMRQGYFAGPQRASIRVRIEGDSANLNIKSARLGIRRLEYEYPVPLAEAEEMLDGLCEKRLVEKTRYHVRHAGDEWEVDVFEGDNAGLVVAEIELPSEEASFDKPEWLGDEVSDDPRYYNVSLVAHPYCDW